MLNNCLPRLISRNFLSKNIIGFSLILFSLILSSNLFAQGPGTAWEFSRSLTLAPVTPLANFQVKVTLTAGQYTHMNADGSDLRFYDNSNNNCNYWIEQWNNTGTSVVWVNVPSLGATGLTMYYGNPAATAVSNGNTTFDFFDDFLGTSLNANWTPITTNGTVTVSGGKVSLANTSGGNNSGGAGIYSAFTPQSTSFVIEVKHQDAAYYRNRFYALDASNPSGNGGSNGVLGLDYGYFSGSIFWNGTFLNPVTANTDYLSRWDITDGTGTPYTWSNYVYSTGTQISTNSVNITKTIRYLSLRVTEQAATSIIVDWARVRKAGSTVASSVGTEVSNLPVPVISSISPSSGCEGSNITINGSGFSSAFGVTVKIGGTPVASVVSNNGTSIVAVIGSGTTGQVTVTTGGGTGTSAGTFTVNLKSTANAGSALSDICQGGTSAPLGGTVTGAATTGTWSDGGIGGTFLPNATNLNATWTPPAGYSGTATLTLTPTSGTCVITTDSKTQKVNPPPTGIVTASSSSICFGSAVTFTAPAGYANYSWKVNGSPVFSSSSNVYTTSNLPVGNPTVTVDITAVTTNCIATLTASSVSIYAYPSGNLIASENSGTPNDNTICAGSAVNFAFDNPAGNTHYKFILNGSTTIYEGANAYCSISALTNGSSVILEVTGPGGCIKTFGPQVITVNPFPVAPASINGPETVCQGANNIIYSVPVIQYATSYTWSVPTGASIISGAGTNSITVSFSTSAISGNVSVNGTNACGDGPIANLAVTVNPLPAAAGSITGFSMVCQGQNGVIYTVPGITNATGYTWVLPSGASIVAGANSNSITVNYATNATSGNITVTGTNSCGNGTVSTNYPVTVNPLPEAAGTIMGTASVCIGTTGVGYSVPSITNATGYVWVYSGSGVTINGSSNSITIDFSPTATSGVLTVTGTNACGNGVVSANYPITINPLPTGTLTSSETSGNVNNDNTICAGSPITFTATVSSGKTYDFKINGTTVQNTTSNTYTTNTLTANATVTVDVTNINGCVATLNTLNIIVNTLPNVTLTGPNPICLGTTNDYTTESGQANYIWNVVGGTVNGGLGTNDLSVTWTSAGTKTINVNYTDANGCTAATFASFTNSPAVVPTISGPNTACLNSSGNLYTTEAGKNDYTWTINGGTINSGSTTNQVSVTWDVAGSKSVSVNYANSDGCNAATPTAFPVTVNTLPGAAVSGTVAVCQNAPAPNLTFTGSTGKRPYTFTYNINGTGTYTVSTTSLSNTVTVAQPTEIPGSFTYNLLGVTDANGCSPASVSGSATITVTPTPSATISYSGTPFCTSSGTSFVSFSGTTGGSYSATPAGLTINSTDGSITPSTSTPGTYTVKYTVAAAGGCSVYSTTASITITALPTVNISYGGSPYCTTLSTSQPVSITGTGGYTGGSYSASPAGLTLNTSTGVIIPSSSTPGTYTVTYATLPANGCGQVRATASVTITPVPSATISYTGSPFCSTLASVPVTISGTGAFIGGTYTSTAGLTINSSTGEINPSTSAPGIYTITYTIPSSGGCSAVPVTTNITITAGPVVNAGTAVSTCAAGGLVNISAGATASNYSSILWTGGNGGTWLNANSITSGTYAPSAADISAGSVTLTLTANGNGNCASVISTKTLTINPNPAPVVVNPATGNICLGGIQPLTSVKDAVTNFNPTFSSTVNTAIPDNNFTGISKSINVSGIPANAIINSISVQFNITHPADVDLTANLTSPNFNTLNLVNSLSGANYTNTVISSAASNPIQTFGTAPYSGTFAPNAVVGALGAAFSTSFNNLYTTSSSLNGNWTFRVADNGVGDVGMFNSWSITINYSIPVTAVPVTWSPATDLYTDAAATVPYAGETISTVYVKASTSGAKTYTATSSSAQGCSTSTNVVLTVQPSPSVFITADYCSNPGKVTLTANPSGTGPFTYNWSDGTTAQTTFVDVAHNYFVSVSNGSGCVGTNSISVAQELVVNGDFTQGNVGFTSGYTYQPDVAGNNELVPDGGTNGYGVGTNGQNYHNNFWGMDHTNNQTGDRNFMIVNGHDGITVWQETVSVQPYTNYYYSAWAMNLNNVSPFARLQFQVNGVNIGTIADLSSADKPTNNSQVNLNNWERFYYGNTNGWYSDTNTIAVIRIVDLEGSHGGNDFGLDDISFATLSPFVTGPDVAGTDNQVICAQSPIAPINYKIGSGATGPGVSGLPPGLTAVFDGLNFTISGSPTTPGTYKYTVYTTGSCANPKADSGVIVVNPVATLSLTSPGNDVQSVCIKANIKPITYSITGGGNYASFINLPDGVSGSYFNGTATISGSPMVSGTFNYQVVTTGTCKQDTLGGTITINDVPVGGNVAAPTICIGDNGTVSLIGYTGTIDHWETSTDGTTFSNIGNITNTQSFTNATQTTFYRVAITNGACSAPVYSSVGKIKISNLWEGKYSADWDNPLNWSSGNLPDNSCSATVTIPKVTGTNFAPVLTVTGTVTNLNILSNGHLTINGGNLQVAGAITNAGILDATAGGVEFNGNAAQNINAGIFLNNAINDLKITNSAGTGVTLNGTIDVYRSLTYGKNGAILNTNGLLTLKSNASQTAWVGDMTNHIINGDVTVERFIASGYVHGKSWQLLATPTKGQTIHEAWQEGCGVNANCKPGYGTQITDASGTANGFDEVSNSPSMKYFNPATNDYIGVSGTNIPIYSPQGYFLFVRGDRSATSLYSPVGETTLRTKGKLFDASGNLPPSTFIPANSFQCIGNPYASAIDMRKIGINQDVSSNFIVWDPKLTGAYGVGAFQTLSFDGTNYTATPGGGSYGSGPVNFIQSGQAFFAQTSTTGTLGGTVSFSEAAKVNGSALITTPNPVSGPTPSFLRSTIFAVAADGTATVVDGVLHLFDGSYSNAIDGLDARKMTNTGLNMGIISGGKILAVEKRQPVSKSDTIHFNITGFSVQQYLFHFDAQNIDPTLQGFLVDNYLKTSTPINLAGGTDITFNVVNIAGSYAANRFMIVFSPQVALPVTFTSIKAYLKDKDIEVEWKVNNERNIKQYVVEKSADGNRFTEMATQEPANNNGVSAVYVLPDTKPADGYNYYRVKSIDVNGNISYTTIVNVLIGSLKQNITIYPNPITDGMIHLQLINQPEGRYKLSLYNKLGQLIIRKQITHPGGNSTQLLQWDYNLAHGMYQLEVTKPDGSVKDITVLY